MPAGDPDINDHHTEMPDQATDIDSRATPDRTSCPIRQRDPSNRSNNPHNHNRSEHTRSTHPGEQGWSTAVSDSNLRQYGSGIVHHRTFLSTMLRDVAAGLCQHARSGGAGGCSLPMLSLIAECAVKETCDRALAPWS
jgi:hypothetical protein